MSDKPRRETQDAIDFRDIGGTNACNTVTTFNLRGDTGSNLPLELAFRRDQSPSGLTLIAFVAIECSGCRRVIAGNLTEGSRPELYARLMRAEVDVVPRTRYEGEEWTAARIQSAAIDRVKGAITLRDSDNPYELLAPPMS